ncbi:MAG TPA: aldo/keto reductase, partial [Gemmatirosa sp.]|nr:aldo/keto reductase [Gemmatirosa sp.]
MTASSSPSSAASTPAAASGTFLLGGDLPVVRLGFGAMRITGDGVWGPPADRPEAIRVLRRCVDLGITFIDTADSYGPHVSEELIAEALHPYPAGLVVATKGGFERSGPNRWTTNGRPEYLRAQCEASLRRLRVERHALWQLHRIDPKVPRDEQFGVLAELVAEGKVRHVGLSEVSVEEIEAARRVVPIASVQNRYNLAERAAEPVLEHCAAHGIAFIPWYPLLVGRLAAADGTLARAAARLGATPAQVALAWLLARSPVMLPIPGTSSVAHLEENV